MIDQIIATPNSPYILICLTQRSSQRNQNQRSRFHLTEANSLKPATVETSPSIDTTFPIPNSIAATIEKPLSLLGEDLLVYLDQSFWVCSYRIVNKTNKSRPRTEHEHEHEREYRDDAATARRIFFFAARLGRCRKPKAVSGHGGLALSAKRRSSDYSKRSRVGVVKLIFLVPSSGLLKMELFFFYKRG